LHAREAVSPGFLGICVAVANPETGHEVAGAADLTLDSPRDVANFLADGLKNF
jgi:trehalose 6-phosphate phosphatase